jgi:hypothetical protein
LEEYQDKCVSMDIDTFVNGTVWFKAFESYLDGKDENMLVVSDREQEQYWFVDVSEVLNVHKNIVDDVVINMKYGHSVVIYKN